VRGLAPADLRVVSAVAKWEVLRGQTANAITLTNAYERTGDATVAEPQALLARSASVLDDLARLPTIAKTAAGRQLTDAAVAKYDALLASRPDVLRASAAALAGDGRGSEAIAKIAKHAKAVPIAVQAAAGVAVLRTAGGTPSEIDQVHTWLAKAVSTEPNSLVLKLAEAEFHMVQNNLVNAEAAYEAVLARDPNNNVALNNLAWLLAPQPNQSERAFALVDRAAKETGLTGELLDTRARIRIAAKQYSLAEQDALEALKQDKTALRYFHLGLAQRAASRPDVEATFREAVRRGLDAKTVHPLDVVTLRSIVAN
jgi:cellulose synthase operon protein C